MKKIALTFVSGLIMLGASAQDVFDFTTGMGGTPAFPTSIPIGSNDDTWSVEVPGFTTTTPRVCVTRSGWDFSACGGQWLSIDTYMDASGNPLNTAVTGDYRYFTSFNITKCPQSAVLNINKMGGDNEIVGMRVNSHVYTLNPAQTNDFSPLITTTVTVNPAHLVTGTNTISIIVRNLASSFGPTTATGFFFCGNLTVNNWPDPAVTITGPAVFCQNDAPSFTFGSSITAGSGSITQYQWQAIPFFSPGTTYSSAIINGTPGTFTFPETAFGCNRNYIIRLRVKNCNTWYQFDKLAQYFCPVADAGPDKTTCEDVCVTIGNNANTGATYTWTKQGSSTVIGTGTQISVCPSVTTTYVVTSNHGGCIDMDEVKVTVIPNNPDFTVSYSAGTSPANYRVTAMPVDLGGFSNPGFIYHWAVEELNPVNDVPYYYNAYSNCWWPWPAQTFIGFIAGSGTYYQLPSCTTYSLPGGTFLYNRKYRITRATKHDYCDWNETSMIVMLSTRSGGEPEVNIYKDENAPSIISRIVENGNGVSVADARPADALSVFPNPSTGVFSVALSSPAEGTVEVFDIMGKRIQTLQLNANTNVYQVDLTGYAKGIYVINITAGGVKQTKKVILE